MMEVCENMRGLEASATLALAARCKELRAAGHDVIDLGVGEPDFRTPEFAAEAGIASIAQGFTHYTPVAGIPALRQAIAAHLAARSGKPVTADGVVTTAGAKQALFNAFFVLFGPGDDVLLPVPYWTSYPSLLRLARASAVLVPGDPAHGFKVTPAQLEAAATPRTRGLVLNSPSNPTGTVYTRAELAALAAWAWERGIWLISDEIYGPICYTAERATSVLDLDTPLERTIIVDGVSKSFAMTGLRLGFSVSRPDVAAQMTALQSHVTSNPSTPAQYAALAAYRDEPRVRHAVRAMVAVFQHRRNKVIELFGKLMPSVEYVQPDGAFYFFMRVDSAFGDGLSGAGDWCARLLEQTGVALVPGEAFGDARYARLSYAAAQAELTDGIRRIAGVLKADLPPVTSNGRN